MQNTVVCRKCKSTQIVAKKRGYSFAKMLKVLGLMALLPLLILVISTIIMTNLLNSNVSSGEGLIAYIVIISAVSMSLSLPVSILVGFMGRSELVNNCMNCGFKWIPAKKKLTKEAGSN